MPENGIRPIKVPNTVEHTIAKKLIVIVLNKPIKITNHILLSGVKPNQLSPKNNSLLRKRNRKSNG